MRPIPLLLMCAGGLAFSVPALADNCGDLATRFAGPDRFSMNLADLDDLKTCINTLLREKISASSNEARGSTSPALSGGSADSGTSSAQTPPSPPVLQDGE